MFLITLFAFFFLIIFAFFCCPFVGLGHNIKSKIFIFVHLSIGDNSHIVANDLTVACRIVKTTYTHTHTHTHRVSFAFYLSRNKIPFTLTAFSSSSFSQQIPNDNK